MSEAYPWYGLTEGEGLEQGDLLLRCPSYQAVTNGEVGVETLNVVLVSHSCDLANDKLDVVQVCPYWPLEAVAAQFEYLRSRKGREDRRRGNLPGYHLLNRCSLPGFESDFLVVDFRSLFGVPLGTAKEVARGQPSRVRLLPPYREHLAQAFARFFMRVGLPVDVPPF
jgi:hypothetical protein